MFPGRKFVKNERLFSGDADVRISIFNPHIIIQIECVDDPKRETLGLRIDCVGVRLVKFHQLVADTKFSAIDA